MNRQTRPRTTDRPIIGLVNNTSGRALRNTERCFRDLLGRASPAGVRLELFRCRELDAVPARAGADGYRDADELFDSGIEGLILTGMEPVTARLSDEPVWPRLTAIIDWAESHSVPTIFSCLAAHAAVLHLDGLARRRFETKASGLFESRLVASGHRLSAGLPNRWQSPHSRYHDLAEQELAGCGYEIVSRTVGRGVDIFAKETGAQFLFLQGHPEYDSECLISEYRRDARRFFLGERGDYPELPDNLFDGPTAAALGALREEGSGKREQAVLVEVLGVLDDVRLADAPKPWAVALFANWLDTVRSRRAAACHAYPSRVDTAWLADAGAIPVLAP